MLLSLKHFNIQTAASVEIPLLRPAVKIITVVQRKYAIKDEISGPVCLKI